MESKLWLCSGRQTWHFPTVPRKPDILSSTSQQITNRTSKYTQRDLQHYELYGCILIAMSSHGMRNGHAIARTGWPLRRDEKRYSSVIGRSRSERSTTLDRNTRSRRDQTRLRHQVHVRTWLKKKARGRCINKFLHLLSILDSNFTH